MDKVKFFDGVRKSGLFRGGLRQPQVDGFEVVLDEGIRRKTPKRHLAYMFATDYHETAATMQPVRETRAATDDRAIAILERAWKAGKLPWVKTPYWRKDANGKSWLGRGLVQLTHEPNYERATMELGVDLLEHPDRAMDMDVAVAIMFEGMAEGWFTGKKLTDYITPAKADYKNARRVINGLDQATRVAGHAVKFERILTESGYDF